MSETCPCRLARDGSSLLRAVRVSRVAEEYAWLHKFFPGHSFKRQDLIHADGWTYDVVTIEDCGGVPHFVWFTIV